MRVIRQSPAAISCNAAARKSVGVLIKGSEKLGSSKDNSIDTKTESERVFVGESTRQEREMENRPGKKD